LVSGSVNMENTMQAVNNTIIPPFHDFMVSNAADKVSGYIMLLYTVGTIISYMLIAHFYGSN